MHCMSCIYCKYRFPSSSLAGKSENAVPRQPDESVEQPANRCTWLVLGQNHGRYRVDVVMYWGRRNKSTATMCAPCWTHKVITSINHYGTRSLQLPEYQLNSASSLQAWVPQVHFSLNSQFVSCGLYLQLVCSAVVDFLLSSTTTTW